MDHSSRRATDRSRAALTPRVLVVGAAYVATLLQGDPTISVHPHVWRNLEDFVDDAAERRIPLAGPFVVCAAAEAATANVSIAEFMALFRDVTVLVSPATTRPELYEAMAARLGGATHLPPALGATDERVRRSAATPISDRIEEMPVAETEWHFERPAARNAIPAPSGDALAELFGTAPSSRPVSSAPTAPPAPPAPTRHDGARPAPRPAAPMPPAASAAQIPAAAPIPPAAPMPPAAPIPAAVRRPDPSFFTGTPNVVPPVRADADPFAGSVRDLLRPSAHTDEYQVGTTRIIAVYSPKGGVGKTSIAVNLATRLAHRTRLSVCIVDLDIGFGNVGTRLGVFTPTIRKLLVEPELDQEAVARNLAYDEHSGLHALLAPLRPEAGADRKLLKPAVYDKILALLVERFDVVFLDCSVELNDPLVAQFALKRAHQVVVVVNNEQATLLDARRAIEAMLRPVDAPRVPGLGLARDNVKIVLNQNVEGVGKDLDQIHTLLTGDDPSHPLNHIPIVSVIPDDRKLWVGHANIARPVATAGNPEIDHALDSALDAVMRGDTRSDRPMTAPVATEASAPEWEMTRRDRGSERDPDRGTGLLGRLRRRKD